MRVLVVLAHPNPESFSHALCDAARRGLETAGHYVDVIDLYAEEFAPAMTETERRAYSGPDPIVAFDIPRHVERLKRAEALVFVYPTWWWGMPAILKGWFDRVLLPGVAFILGERRPQPALQHVRRLVGITTYGAGRLEMLFFNDAGRRTITRTLRLLTAHRTKSTWFGLYRMDAAGDQGRRAFLERVERGMAGL